MGKEAKSKSTNIKRKDFDKNTLQSSVFKIPFKDRIKLLFNGFIEVLTPAIKHVNNYPVTVKIVKKPKGK